MPGSNLCIPRNEITQLRYIFPKQNYNVLSPNFNTMYSIWGLPIFCSQKADLSWEYISCLQTHECRNWEWWCTASFLGTNKSNFRSSAYSMQFHTLISEPQDPFNNGVSWLNSLLLVLAYALCTVNIVVQFETVVQCKKGLNFNLILVIALIGNPLRCWFCWFKYTYLNPASLQRRHHHIADTI